MPDEPHSHEDESHGHDTVREPIDPDVDLHQPGPPRRGRNRRVDTLTLATISAGGATGAAARYLIGTTWPTPRGTFPVGTLTINVAGCALMGVLMVLITQVWSRQRLLRPFLGTGVLGGFTTFSTYTVDIQQRLADGQVTAGLLYLALTPIGAFLAVWMAAIATRRMVARSVR